MPVQSTNDFLRLLQELTRGKIDFAVVGGTAAVLHGASTATYDLDVVMPFTLVNCERLLRVTDPLNPRLSHTPDKRPLTLTAQELVGFKSLYLSTTLGRLDVLGSLPPVGTAEEVIAGADWMVVGEDTQVRVVGLDSLIRVKAAMDRPKDKQVELELRAISEAKARLR